MGDVAAHLDGVDPVLDATRDLVETQVGPPGDVAGRDDLGVRLLERVHDGASCRAQDAVAGVEVGAFEPACQWGGTDADNDGVGLDPFAVVQVELDAFVLFGPTPDCGAELDVHAGLAVDVGHQAAKCVTEGMAQQCG